MSKCTFYSVLPRVPIVVTIWHWLKINDIASFTDRHPSLANHSQCRQLFPVWTGIHVYWVTECMQRVVQLWQHLTVVTLHCVPTHTQTLRASWLRTGFSDQRSSSAKCDTDLWSSDWLNWHTRSLSLAGVCREKIQNMPHVLQLWGVFLAPEILPRVDTSQ